MKNMTGKQALLEMLRLEGVQHIFGNPGTSESPFIDALSDFPDLNYILALQEGVAVGMADGYARVSGKPGVCLAQTVGGANLAAGLRDAWLARSPVIAVTGGRGQVSSAQHILVEPLGVLAHRLAEAGGEINLMSHGGGTPSGLMLVRCGCLRSIPSVGFIDFKEQALPLIARTRAGHASCLLGGV